MKWSASSSTTLLSRLLVALLQCSFLVSASASSAAHQQSPRNLQSQSFYILLELTFDTSPSKIAWKLDNARTRTTLADAPFGAYDDSMANMTIRVPLEFMTEKDLKSDPWVEGQTRDYKFTVFDREGDGLCCDKGQGKYELYSLGNLIAEGDDFGTLEEHYFFIDPLDYYVIDSSGGSGGSPSSTSDGSSSNNMMPNNGEGSGNMTPNSDMVSFSSPTDEDMSGSMMSESNTTDGSSSGSSGGNDGSSSGGSSMAVGEDINATTGGGAAAVEGPTTSPVPSVTYIPTTSLEPTSTARPTIMPLPLVAQEILDQSAWFCGKDWDSVSPKCEDAVPCPDGDDSVCPEGQGCFASTPCTLSPTFSPSVAPSTAPSSMPSSSPTRAPWSQAEFMAFLNAEGGNGSSSSGSSSSVSGGSTAPQTMSGGEGGGPTASATTDTMSEYSDLQYHFFCGYNFFEANMCTSNYCLTGDKEECPVGMKCFANTKCDGRLIPPLEPMSSAVGPIPISDGEGAGSNIQCTLCGGKGLSLEVPIMFQGNPSTCGELDVMVGQFNSDACMTVRDTYQEACCYDGCQLCQTMEGDFLDLKKDHAVWKGEYMATCDEIQNLLTTFAKNDEMCADSQSQLAEECCYDQCSLCESSEATKWNSMVEFENMTTTCLGLDYLLRTEQIISNSGRCTDLQEEYASQCCRAEGSKPDPCKLCKAENGDEYGVKNTTLQQLGIGDSTITCDAMASAMFVMERDDEQCISAKEKYFDPCCNLTDAQHIVHNAAGATNSTSNATVDVTSDSNQGYWGSNPSTDFTWEARTSVAGFVSLTKVSLWMMAISCSYFIM